MMASEIAARLDELMDIGAFNDSSHNGLQVDRTGAVNKICCGVDASLAFVEESIRRGADMVAVHHGLSWGDSLKRIVSIEYRRLAALMRGNVALYACHLPLDAHPTLGNNALLCDALGLLERRPFGLYHGRAIGFAGRLAEPMPLAGLKRTIARKLRCRIQAMEFGSDTVQTVGIVSGGAADEVREAGEQGLDVYLSGEPNLSAYHLAQELRINALFCGHYATEVFGVRALAGWLRAQLGIEAEFIDFGIPY